MLKRLRRKLVAVILVMVGSVLVLAFSTSFFSLYHTQQGIISEALELGLSGNVRSISEYPAGSSEARAPKVLAITVDVDQSGVVLESNYSSVVIDKDVFRKILETASRSESSEGYDATAHVAWRKALISDGALRVAMVDTYGSYYSLRAQLLQDVAIVIMGLAALAAISWWISGWILQPVEDAWEQQHRFISDASHELKTPLSVIIANTEILLREEGLPAGSRRWIESTADESSHMKGLVEELLELARADEDQLRAGGISRKDDVDLSEMVESASLEFDAVAFERGSAIEDSIEGDVHVTGDEVWLSRLVRILLDNACKYAYAGTTVTVSLRRQGRSCVLSVTNVGDVIAPEDLKHIFDRFYRTDQARSRDSRAGGFGLGLAIAKSVAISSGGDIHATSSEEAGTTLSVTLPLRQPSQLRGQA